MAPAVQRVDAARLERQAAQARHRAAENQSEGDGAEHDRRRDGGHGQRRERRQGSRMGEQQCPGERLQGPEHDQYEQQPQHRVAGVAQGRGRQLGHRLVIAPGLGRSAGRAVPDLPGRDLLTGQQRRAVTELCAGPERGVGLKHRLLADERPGTDLDAPQLDRAAEGAIAVQQAVLAYDGTSPDLEQIGDDRHVAGEDHRARADPCPERPQVEVVEGRAGHQPRQRVGDDEGANDPEANVAEAPDRDPPAGPAPDQQPFDHDRQQAGAEQRAGTERQRPRVQRDGTARAEHPTGAHIEHGSDRRGVEGEGHQLERAAQHRPGAAAHGPERGAGRRDEIGRGGRLPQRDRQRADRPRRVDLADRRAPNGRVGAQARGPARQQQRAGAELVEQVGRDRHLGELEQLGERSRQNRLEPAVGLGVGAPAVGAAEASGRRGEPGGIELPARQ